MIEKSPNLFDVIQSLKAAKMETLNIVANSEVDILGKDDRIDAVHGLEFWDKIMAEKKTHEVKP